MTSLLRLISLAIPLSLALASMLLGGCVGKVARESDGLHASNDLNVANSVPIVTIETGQMRSTTGCVSVHSIYRTRGAEGPVEVVLAHGYRRERARMDGLAQALAAAGLTTATIDLCNMFVLDVAHRQNAADMQALAKRLGGPRVLYAGFSYGGLAALLAAQNDPKSVGVLALDLVDQTQIAESAAARLDRPIVGLFGDASRCNVENNGLAVMAAARQSEVIRIEGATHCDFEAPTDGLCRKVCGKERSDESEAQTRSQIIERAVQAALRLIDTADSAGRLQH